MTPEKEHSCYNDTTLCCTLSHIVEHPINYSSNTEIIFLPGIHTTNTNGSIVVANVSNITVDGRGSVIQCIKDQGVGFVFIDIKNMSITNLHLCQCGAKLPDKIVQLINNHSEFSKLYSNCDNQIPNVHYKDFYTKSFPALYLFQVTTVTISWVNIRNSSGPGLLGLNLMGHSTISQSFFIGNHPNCAFLLKDTALQSLSLLDSKIIHREYINKHMIGKAGDIMWIFLISQGVPVL